MSEQNSKKNAKKSTRLTTFKSYEPPRRIKCRMCGKIMIKDYAEIARGKGRFCSTTCSHAHKRDSLVEMQCLHCEKFVWISAPKMVDQKFCKPYCREQYAVEEHKKRLKACKECGKKIPYAVSFESTGTAHFAVRKTRATRTYCSWSCAGKAGYRVKSKLAKKQFKKHLADEIEKDKLEDKKKNITINIDKFEFDNDDNY